MVVDKSKPELFISRFSAELPYLIRDGIHIFKDLKIPNKGIVTVSYTPLSVVKCTGLSSICKKSNTHVIFLDHDSVYERVVIDDIAHLQNEHGLGTAYLFSTRRMVKNVKEFWGNYLSIFLDQKTFKETIELQKELHTDDLYKHPEDFSDKGHTIRISQKGFRPKPELIRILKADSLTPKSNAHRIFLEKFCEISIPKDPTFDDEQKVRIVRYTTFA